MQKLGRNFQIVVLAILLAVGITSFAQDTNTGFREEVSKTQKYYDEASREIVESAANSGDVDALFVWGYRVFWDDLDGQKNDEDFTFDNIEGSVLSAQAARAIPWFEKAAKLDHAESMNWLATIFEKHIPEPDREKAIQYLELSAEAGSSAAKVNYGIRMIDDEAKANLALKYLLEAEAEVDWTVNSPDFNMALFRVYSFELAEQKYDPVRAVSYGKNCAYGEYILPECQFLLARYYQKGWGVEMNVVEAAQLFEVSANGDNSAAQWYLGMAYLNGEGVEKNNKTAYSWVKRSAENEYIDGMISFAVMNALGEGTEINPQLSFKWYEKATYLGSHHALRSIGYMLYTGEGSVVDEEVGVAALVVASEEDELAINALREIIDDYDIRAAEIAKEYAVPIAEVRTKYGF